MIVEHEDYVTLLGAGPLSDAVLSGALTLAPRLVAVDGGADHALARGLLPAQVVGDLDGLSADARRTLAGRLVPETEQVTTDFDKALRLVEAQVLVAVGFSGGRLDHELAALSGLLRAAHRSCVICGETSLSFLCPPDIALDLPPGTTLSLYPLVAVGLRSSGLVWPTDGLDFRPEGRLGTSNSVGADGKVRLRAERPGMLVILPVITLPQVLPSLAAAPRWPSPVRGE